MARKTVIVFTDDLTGEEVAPDNIAQAKFTIEGVEYLLEGHEKSIAKFHKAVAPFTEKATKTGGRTARGKQPRKSTAENLDKIRTWARENGHEVSDRGRIPGHVVEAYNVANGANV